MILTPDSGHPRVLGNFFYRKQPSDQNTKLNFAEEMLTFIATE
jgi:hypothetical protein